MPVICWAPLAKSAQDPTTIASYIAAKILNHDIDSAAHGLDGYALFNHRDAYPCDHPDYSIFGKHIQPYAVTAEKIDVNELSAISADIGAITAGTITGIVITGGTIQTNAAVNTGVKLTSGGEIHIFGDECKFFKTDGTAVGYIGGATGNLYISTQNSKDLHLMATGGDIRLRTTMWGGVAVSLGNATQPFNYCIANFVQSGNSYTLQLKGGLTKTIYSDSDFLPKTTNAFDLGTSLLKWKDIYVDGIAYLDAISMGGNILPEITNTYDIGSATYKLKDIFAAGKIWTNNLDVDGLCQVDEFRLDQTPQEGYDTPTHFVTMNFNGVEYAVFCLAT